jgi:hypothetical protein
MHTYIMIAMAIVIAAKAFETRSFFFHGRINTAAFATSNTRSPHEIHLNDKGMKELPVHEVKEPF